MKNRISDLRNHLFATLEALQDQENPMEIDRARAVAEVSQTIINSAKIEVDFLKVTGIKRDAGFLSDEKPALEPPAGAGRPVMVRKIHAGQAPHAAQERDA